MSADAWSEFLGRRCGKDDRLEIRRKLGEGGVGAVFEAVDTVSGHSYAIKFLHDAWSGDEQFLHRFKNEGTRWKEIQHPNLVRVFGLGRQFGMLFILSEMVVGRQLEEVLATEGRLAPDEAFRIAREIADGLAEIHRHEIVHRDLKPQNVIIQDTDRKARVLDYGMAKYVSSNSMLTKPGETLGTPGYMAPEQIAAGPIDYRVDIFALGTILIEMLTGGNAFVGGSNKEILRATVQGQIQGLDKITEIGGKPLAKFVSQLVDAQPKRRPSTMQEVIALLDSVAAEVATGRTTRSQGLFGFLRRRSPPTIRE